VENPRTTNDQQPALDALLDEAPCGFVSFADDGTVRLANQTLLDMLGLERERIVGRHVENLLTVGGRIFYQTHLFPLLRLHGRAEEIFLVLRSATGEEVGVLANAVRRRRDDEPVTDVVVMRVRERRKFEDALVRAKQDAESARAKSEAHQAELKAANAQLEQQAVELEEANHAKSAFLAAMSHELRTPLNAIGGYVQLIEMGIHGPVSDAQRETLGKVARSQRHLLRLINEVLNLAKIEAGGVNYEIRDVTVKEMVDAVLPMVEPQMAERGLACEVSVPQDLRALADRDKAEQVLLNLLGNAVKFTQRGGRVRVEARVDPASPEHALLQVSDTGIGIPSDRLEAVFEPFVQVSTDPARRAEGSGLGLAISRDLARGMGGELTASSVAGQGSTFTLVLPRNAEPR
jgi:PAS domain S-box-containing protein